MKRLYVTILALAQGWAAWSAPFANLGFEEAQTNNLHATGRSGFIGPAGDLLPGWTLSRTVYAIPGVGYNLVYNGGTWCTIYDKDYRLPGEVLAGPSDGRYAFACLPGYAVTPPYDRLVLYRLSQLGDVPAEARSLRFDAWGDPFEVRIQGQPVPLAQDGSVFTADVSAFAGEAAELSFTTVFILMNATAYNALDNIRFSTDPAPIPFIPEPSTWALLALGGLAVAWRLRKRSSA